METIAKKHKGFLCHMAKTLITLLLDLAEKVQMK